MFLMYPVPLASHISEHISFFPFDINHSNFRIIDKLDSINAKYVFISLVSFCVETR
jgi:hypothetical protein